MKKVPCPQIYTKSTARLVLLVLSSLVLGFTFSLTCFTLLHNVFAAEDPVSFEWDFSVPADYNLSDPSLVEISNDAARLKVHNYTSDSDTRGLYHLDEEVGVATADDASSNNNDAAVENGTFVPAGGILGGALEFNGSNSMVTATGGEAGDPPYLSQSNTLETWVKFTDDYDPTVSSTTNNNRMTLFDRGSYKLYFDDDTGKLTYELALIMS